MGTGPSRGSLTAVWSGTVRWVGGLVLVTLLYVIAGGRPAEASPAWWLLEQLTQLFGMLLPFAAFAGGIAARSTPGPRRATVRAVVVASLGIAVLSYVATAIIEPVLDYAAAERRQLVTADGLPYEPYTPAELLRRRALITADPPATYSFDIDRPLDRPPNWLTYELHLPVVFALFAILNTLLGFFAAGVTTGLSPPVRRHARWIAGLVGGIAFFVAVSAGAAWVRSDTGVSGVAGAWLPILIPLAELAVLGWIAKRSGHDLHAPPPGRV